MAGDTSHIGTKPLDNRAPGSYNPNSGSVAGNTNEDVLQHSSGVRNQPGGSTQGGVGPYQRTPANYAGGPGPNPNSTITLYAQKWALYLFLRFLWNILNNLFNFKF